MFALTFVNILLLVAFIISWVIYGYLMVLTKTFDAIVVFVLLLLSFIPGVNVLLALCLLMEYHLIHRKFNVTPKEK